MQQNETESGYVGEAPLTSMKAICSQSTLYMSWLSTACIWYIFLLMFFFLYFKTFTKTDVYITVDAFIILTLERGRSKKRKNASIINIIFVQVNNFQKVSFVPHFIKEFERKFYTTAVLLYRIFQLFLHVSKSQYFFPI